jgi:hypothetical protein
MMEGISEQQLPSWIRVSDVSSVGYDSKDTPPATLFFAYPHASADDVEPNALLFCFVQQTPYLLSNYANMREKDYEAVKTHYHYSSTIYSCCTVLCCTPDPCCIPKGATTSVRSIMLHFRHFK